MIHDPMCGMYLSCNVCGNGSNKCTCRLIARVREDTWKSADAVVNAMREETLRDAVEAVKAVYTPQEGTYIGLCMHADAVAAIEALSVNADTNTIDGERRRGK